MSKGSNKDFFIGIVGDLLESLFGFGIHRAKTNLQIPQAHHRIISDCWILRLNRLLKYHFSAILRTPAIEEESLYSHTTNRIQIDFKSQIIRIFYGKAVGRRIAQILFEVRKNLFGDLFGRRISVMEFPPLSYE